MSFIVRVFILSLFTLSFLTASAGEKEIVKKEEVTPLDSTDRRPCDTPDEFPSFVGGDEALFLYIKVRLKYPIQAVSPEIEGRVVVRFIIEEDGRVSEVKAIRSVDPLLDNEAIRIVRSMPKWNPGRVNGKPVRVYYSLPITFRLPD